MFIYDTTPVTLSITVTLRCHFVYDFYSYVTFDVTLIISTLCVTLFMTVTSRYYFISTPTSYSVYDSHL